MLLFVIIDDSSFSSFGFLLPVAVHSSHFRLFLFSFTHIYFILFNLNATHKNRKRKRKKKIIFCSKWKTVAHLNSGNLFRLLCETFLKHVNAILCSSVGRGGDDDGGGRHSVDGRQSFIFLISIFCFLFFISSHFFHSFTHSFIREHKQKNRLKAIEVFQLSSKWLMMMMITVDGKISNLCHLSLGFTFLQFWVSEIKLENTLRG